MKVFGVLRAEWHRYYNNTINEHPSKYMGERAPVDYTVFALPASHASAIASLLALVVVGRQIELVLFWIRVAFEDNKTSKLSAARDKQRCKLVA